ncbi:uncharacterized protein E0L32_003672 [Thyridium curvatum]|uniref:RNA polymerase II holoenzyme cyclin-like subunit n=1 Tax=Thyridium curvatum TaxID=1093900 RepID=A0A507BIC0_9PEZI|nr:uncharacterized protein E0L32_003672 [Thyridium curvatum]TPX16731.1 hypothetical protein E0L32_003672 [Thyridium curvatum]
MASIDKYRPAREGYQPPSIPSRPPQRDDRQSRSPSRRRDVPPAVPSPPSLSSRTSPPRPQSRRNPPSPAPSAPRTPARTPASQWLYTPDEVLSSPSIIDGLSPAEEKIRRAKGVNFIYQAGIIIEPHALPSVTLFVASVFFHRFYMRYSMVEEKGGIHHYNIAATALFLANKTEENCFKTKNIIIAVAKVAQKNPKLIIDEQSKEYWRWRDSILMYEELMLEVLTFDLMVTNPYEQLWNQLNRLNLLNSKRIRAAGWTFCNDAALTVLPLLMDARDIAIASIFFASTLTGEKIADSGDEPWWKFLRADEDKVARAIDVMEAFYIENPLKKQNTSYQGSPKFSLEDTRRRGDVSQTDAGSSNNGTPLPSNDRGTASPVESGRRPRDGDKDSDAPASQFDPDMLQQSQGDSDVALKVAANDLDHHRGRPNGKAAMLSPGVKRKSVEPDSDDAERHQKRSRRQSESDEGEVRDDD